MKHKNIGSKFALLLSGLVVVAAAHAKPTLTPPVVQSVSDVTLAGVGSDAFLKYASNAQAHGGDSSGFSPTFGGGWSTLALFTTTDAGALTSSSATNTVGNTSFTVRLTENAGLKSGTWSIIDNSAKNVMLDLVFAIHAGGSTGAYFLDNRSLVTNQVTAGSWTVGFVNGGNQIPNFSNLTVFAREVQISAVPEPETYAMLLAGLGMIGFVARRRKIRAA